MSFQQVLKRKLESEMKEIEQNINSSFNEIDNFIDQIFTIDNPIKIINNVKSELSLPKVNKFNLIGQSDFQQNMIKEVTPLINQKIKHQLQIKSKLHQQQQQSIINSQSQNLNQNIVSQSQINQKPFTYQIIQNNSIKKQECCCCFAFNKDCSFVAVGCQKQIIIYQFKQRIQQQIQVLDQHKGSVLTLNFMKKSNYLISGGYDNNIIIWSINNNNQWVCSQTIQEHNNRINCLIINNNEDLFISGSDDKTIKFWIKKNQWICLQTITDHQSEVYSLSLNEQQNQVISCGVDNLILIIEYSELNRNWIVIQKINVDCYGIRLCFIDDNLFTFKPYNGNLMYVYEKNSVSKQFTKTKDIIVNQGNDYNILFPQQYIKQKQLLVNRHNEYVNFIRKRENGEFKLEQSIEFNTNLIFGSLSDDGDYFITWDESSKEIQIRKYTEE